MSLNNAPFDEDDFPSNSHKKKEEKKIEKVVTGSVIRKKKTLGDKFVEFFCGEDSKSVGNYILHDVLIPSAKDMIADMVRGGIEMMLYGERRGSHTTRDRGRSYVSYSSYYKSDERDKRDSRREMSSANRARHNFDDIILETRGSAEEVLSNLVDLIIDYGLATVHDLYSLVGITPNYTDNTYGWTDLSSASVERVRGGYLIRLPRPKPID